MVPYKLATRGWGGGGGQGKYDFKLLAVDIPTAAGEQRIFLDGDHAVYDRGSVINELRDPFIQACAAPFPSHPPSCIAATPPCTCRVVLPTSGPPPPPLDPALNTALQGGPHTPAIFSADGTWPEVQLCESTAACFVLRTVFMKSYQLPGSRPCNAALPPMPPAGLVIGNDAGTRVRERG